METRKSQKIANELDCEIHRLLRRCEGMLVEDQGRREYWASAASHLQQARWGVRCCMNAKDRKET
jgi:hypothetical protein